MYSGDNTHLMGSKGEEMACRFLIEKGYDILEKNYRNGRFEIDIIAEIDDTLVFFEVKTAYSRMFGNPLTWVTKRKIRHIYYAALAYITAKDIKEKNLRFDVIGIESMHGEISIEHIENAFSAPGGI